MTRGYQPDWDGDRLWGEEGEQYIRDLIDRPWEAKRKSYIDSSFYVELEQDPGATGQHWKPSGLVTTKAENMFFVVAETGIIVIFPTVLLRAAISRNLGKNAAETDGDCPTRGKLLDLDQVLWFAKKSGWTGV